MGKLNWYKRFPHEALEGMFELTLEERGAYNTVIDLIYARVNKLPDEDRFISGHLRCDVRVWRRIRARLLGLGKIEIVDGRIANDRCTSEIDSALSRGLSARQAALTSWRSRPPKSSGTLNENNVVTGTEPLAEPPADPHAIQSKTQKDKIGKELVGNTEPDIERSSSERKSVVSPRERNDANGLDPVSLAFDEWNIFAQSHGLPLCQRRLERRKAALRQRLKEAGGIEGWRTALAKAALIPWMFGANDRGWRLNIDSLIGEKFFTKLMEGAHANADPAAIGARLFEELERRRRGN